MPAVPLDEAGKFVAGAYVVFVALILLYVAIMAAKLVRIERELRSLTRLAEERLGENEDAEPPPADRTIVPQMAVKRPDSEP